MDGDSPLSITANIVGLLTFLVAVVAGFYARASTFQARLRFRDEILTAILDSMEAFSETCTLATDYSKLKEESYVPHEQFNGMLHFLYIRIFELMGLILDLGCTHSVSAARALSKKRGRLRSLIGEIEAQRSKVREAYLFARLQDNILRCLGSNLSVSQDLKAKPGAEGGQLREHIEVAAM